MVGLAPQKIGPSLVIKYFVERGWPACWFVVQLSPLVVLPSVNMILVSGPVDGAAQARGCARSFPANGWLKSTQAKEPDSPTITKGISSSSVVRIAPVLYQGANDPC
jgi:hypothetical protein